MADILDYCKGQQVQRFDSGETMIAEGTANGKLFVLISGQIEVIRKDTQVSFVDEPGSMFGEMSVLLEMPHSATVKALSDVEAYVIEGALEFLESRAEVTIRLATLLARRLYYTTTYLVDLQQQFEGKRHDLDAVDQIFNSLVEAPAEAQAAKGTPKRAAKSPRKT